MQFNTPPKAGSKTSDFVGIPLVITTVHGLKDVETSLGEAQAVVVDLLVLDYEDPVGFPGDDDYSRGTAYLRDVPGALVFWSVVQRQLLSRDFAPPVAGKFVLHGKAYILEPLSDVELELIAELDSFDSNHPAAFDSNHPAA